MWPGRTAAWHVLWQCSSSNCKVPATPHACRCSCSPVEGVSNSLCTAAQQPLPKNSVRRLLIIHMTCASVLHVGTAVSAMQPIVAAATCTARHHSMILFENKVEWQGRLSCNHVPVDTLTEQLQWPPAVCWETTERSLCASWVKSGTAKDETHQPGPPG
ncbi:hypothetical protein COO60DRAFT_223633 [Scenedesmus sp. NREL 46B-D3]|nr:hypothetical protein COO60DRAFT_223633 [Scenedesmus sp. NREL 46B-D3]